MWGMGLRAVLNLVHRFNIECELVQDDVLVGVWACIASRRSGYHFRYWFSQWSCWGKCVITPVVTDSPLDLGRSELMSVERADPSMRLQLGSVLSAPEMKSVANGYFLQNLIWWGCGCPMGWTLWGIHQVGAAKYVSRFSERLLSGSPVKRSTGSGDIYYSFRAVLIKWGHLVWAMHQLHFSILWIALWLGWLVAVYLDDLMV